MRFSRLAEWLHWMKSLHPLEMDFKLDRVQRVAERLNLLNPSFPIVTVGGTNGKGSCIRGLESIYQIAGYKVGAFTSPFLIKHNETIRIAGKEMEDAFFCTAFQQIDEVREGITLTLFEFNTLAALLLFRQEKIDVGLLEVGLGGRLDAVNIIAADVALIASIGLDHTDLLGTTRDEIAREKAGIFRERHPAISGDFNTPEVLIDYAKTLKVPLYCQGKEFGFEKKASSWTWWSQTERLENLALTQLQLQNMSSVLMAVELLKPKLPVSPSVIYDALMSVTLPGRIQVIPGEILQIFDVSHNPDAARVLAHYVKHHLAQRKIHAVFSMLADKDIIGTLLNMRDCVDVWYTAPLLTERAASEKVLAYCFQKSRIKEVTFYDTILTAYQEAMKNAKEGECVIVFGSFHTVAETLVLS